MNADVPKAVKPPPPPARDPPVPKAPGATASSSRPEPPELPGAAKSAPNVDRSRSRTYSATPQIEYSCLFELERPGYGVHYAFDVIGGIDSNKITVGIDWHRVISPYGVDRYNYPSPLFVTQLKELAEEFQVQYWVNVFHGIFGILSGQRGHLHVRGSLRLNPSHPILRVQDHKSSYWNPGEGGHYP